jgi:hypothetical protein
MPRTLLQLKQAVAGFCQRDIATFTRQDSGYDVLLQACNNARLYAERNIDFEKSFEQAYVVISDLTAGVNLSTAVTYDTRNAVTPTSVSIKKIVKPFIASTNGQLVPVTLWSKRKWNDRLERKLELIDDRTAVNLEEGTSMEILVVQQADKIFVYPASTTLFASGSATLALDVVKWLSEYTTNTDTDFLMTYCFDWLMYRTIYELNFYLKEDERVQLSDKLIQDSWDAMIRWNNELIESATGDTDLR